MLPVQGYLEEMDFIDDVSCIGLAWAQGAMLYSLKL
jgi:hypothetical protein